MEQPTHKGSIIRNIYFYLVTFVALMMVVFSTADIINIVLRTYVFTKADQAYYYSAPCAASVGNQDETNKTDCAQNRDFEIKQNKENMVSQRQRDIVRDISFILVGIPLFILHWNIVKKRE